MKNQKFGKIESDELVGLENEKKSKRLKIIGVAICVFMVFSSLVIAISILAHAKEKDRMNSPKTHLKAKVERTIIQNRENAKQSYGFTKFNARRRRSETETKDTGTGCFLYLNHSIKSGGILGWAHGIKTAFITDDIELKNGKCVLLQTSGFYLVSLSVTLDTYTVDIPDDYIRVQINVLKNSNRELISYKTEVVKKGDLSSVTVTFPFYFLAKEEVFVETNYPDNIYTQSEANYLSLMKL